MDKGSPLLVFSKNLGKKLEKQFGIHVEVAMRYGRPSIKEALSSFESQNIQEIKVLPLYPQFCDATVTTTINKVIKENQGIANISVIPPFYSKEAFVKSSANVIIENLPEKFDHLLFSYHSLPESQVKFGPHRRALSFSSKLLSQRPVQTSTAIAISVLKLLISFPLL